MTASATPKLDRTTFVTSRELDFCSEKELTAQTGHSQSEWPGMIIKELIDNALDACEEASISPEITVKVNEDGITVRDNGPGIPAETITGVTDYSSRTSSREAYVAPDRGAQGNALKTILPVPFVLGGDSGRVDITSHGERHEITFSVDQIRQKPTIKRTVYPDENVKNGTVIKVWWPADYLQMLSDSSWPFLQQLVHFGLLNPHLSLELEWFDEELATEGTDPTWPKWQPSDPTSAHWYAPEDFERFVGAHIAHDQDRQTDRSVREVVKMFRGLTGTAKQKVVLEATGLARRNLSSLANGKGLDHQTVAALLEAMKAHSKPPKPTQLGVIGRDHISNEFADLGCDLDTFEYRKKVVEGIDDVPCVIEVEFACCKEQGDRSLIAGVNWSAAIRNPFRNLGSPAGNRSYGDGLDDLLERQHAGADEPVVLFIHLACPRVRYTDRGKSAVAIDWRLGRYIKEMVIAVTSKWCKLRRREERDSEQRFKRRQLLQREKPKTISLKDAVFQKMEEGIRLTSGNRKYVFPKRNLYYTVRDLVQELTDKELTWDWFQGIVNQYEAEHGPIPGMYCDPRGYLIEPHTGKSIPLGTREVDDYDMPSLLYDKILYVEKKGQQPIFQKARLAEKYDMAIICAEGYATRAVKTLLSAAQANREMTVLCLHDADPYGYNIARTLREATALCPNHNIDVIDIGLRLGEALDMGLQTEVFYRKNALPSALKLNALEREKFTGTKRVGSNRDKAVWKAERVELNALARDPDRFIEWVEQKLADHGVAKKLVPPADVITRTARNKRSSLLHDRISGIVGEILDFDSIVATVVEDHLSDIPIEHVPDEVQAWSHKLRPERWTDRIQRLVEDAIYDIRDQIRATAEVRTSELLEDLT